MSAVLRHSRIRHSSFRSSFHTLYLSAELAQFFIQMFVAAIDMINAADFGDSIRLQSGKHKRGRRAQIARHHRRAKETIDALDHGGWSLKIDMCAHALELRHVHIALRKNVFCDDADSASGGKKRTHLC